MDTNFHKASNRIDINNVINNRVRRKDKQYLVKRQTNSLKSKNKKKTISNLSFCVHFVVSVTKPLLFCFPIKAIKWRFICHTHTHTVVSNSDRFYLGKFGQVFGARMC